MPTRFFAAALLFLSGTFVPTMVPADGVLAFPSYGIVDSVREVRLTEELSGVAGMFEHACRPPSADELLVTLDDGRAITVVQTVPQIFAPGQRVRVVSHGPDARIEHADGHPLP